MQQQAAHTISQKNKSFLGLEVKFSILASSISKKHVKLFIARVIIRSIPKWKSLDSIEISYFNKINFMQDKELIDLLIPLLCPKMYEDLCIVIKLSNKSNSISLAAANAISILNRTNFEFRNLDFRGINISNSCLSKNAFINVNFKGSCLKGVNFCQSKLYDCNFRNCDFTEALFSRLKIIEKFEGSIKKVIISKDGKLLLLCCARNTILWDLNLKMQLHSSNFISKSAAFSPCGNLIILVDEGIKVFIKWDRKLGIITEKANTKLVRSQKIYNVCFSPCGKYILFWGSNFIELEDSVSLNIYKKWKAYPYTLLNFTKCGKYIIFGDKGWIKQISIESDRVEKLIHISWMAKELTFSPSHKHLSCNGGNLFIIKFETQELIFAEDMSRKGFNYSTSWSPYNDKIVVSDGNGFCLFDIEKQAPVAHMRENYNKNDSICYSKCGRYVFIGKSNGLLKLWDLENIG
ncbi:unnamed protein product [Blepharisma stoltei]|uniref:BTB/POZ domain-containing protein n=1 Tax=Blepharisma stoltei TaxID=1481888 RepID=A0AAU9KFA6_9CILI|nr:unnamed protein product [Blepharisma stoltei]